MTNENMELIADLLIKLGVAMKQTNNVEHSLGNCLSSTNTNKYLTRKELLEIYSPVITEYGLRQAMSMDNFPFIKRGKQFFFIKDEVDKWLLERNSTNIVKNKTVKYV